MLLLGGSSQVRSSGPRPFGRGFPHTPGLWGRKRATITMVVMNHLQVLEMILLSVTSMRNLFHHFPLWHNVTALPLFTSGRFWWVSTAGRICAIFVGSGGWRKQSKGQCHCQSLWWSLGTWLNKQKFMNMWDLFRWCVIFVWIFIEVCGCVCFLFFLGGW